MKTSEFTSPAGLSRFLAAHDAALTRLMPFPPSPVPTSFGTAVAYRGGASSGTPIVLVPGAGGSAITWYRLVARLGRDNPVIALDLVGEPGAARQTAPITTARDVAVSLAETLDALDVPRAHLVGMSYGGWTALRHEIDLPGRAASLTLLDPAGFGRVTTRFMLWLIAGGLASFAPRALRHRLAGPLRNATLRDDELMALLPLQMSFRRRLPAPDVFTDTELSGVDVPTMFLLGEHSALYPAASAAARLTSVMPKARVEIVPGASHDVPTYAPDEVADRIATFLTSV
ncbi:alpha/beta fold hydrolase [Catenuloplanes japonicus]|uniref:alpha/beta fold hydrolase n=1 Tax=Catenuloplanes japonicus TaxID=33876 RepID=UPI000525916B|nr:alpha/beta fold hydrolase [Catenuloplanes japonicus]